MVDLIDILNPGETEEERMSKMLPEDIERINQLTQQNENPISVNEVVPNEQSSLLEKYAAELQKPMPNISNELEKRLEEYRQLKQQDKQNTEDFNRLKGYAGVANTILNAGQNASRALGQNVKDYDVTKSMIAPEKADTSMLENQMTIAKLKQSENVADRNNRLAALKLAYDATKKEQMTPYQQAMVEAYNRRVGTMEGNLAQRVQNLRVQTRLKDEKSVRDAIKSANFGSIGMAQTQGSIIKRLLISDDAKRIIDSVKSGQFKANPQVARELATSLATAITGGSAPTQTQIDELVPQSLKGKIADLQQFATAKPQTFLSKDFLDHFEHQIQGQQKYWGEKANESAKKLYHTVKPVFERQDIETGLPVNKDLLENWENSIASFGLNENTQNKTTNSMNTSDENALKWLKANPNHEKAESVRAKLKAKGLL